MQKIEKFMTFLRKILWLLLFLFIIRNNQLWGKLEVSIVKAMTFGITLLTSKRILIDFVIHITCFKIPFDNLSNSFFTEQLTSDDIHDNRNQRLNLLSEVRPKNTANSGQLLSISRKKNPIQFLYWIWDFLIVSRSL